MRMRMEQGDYVPNGVGGFYMAEEEQRRLQQALFLLTARRGKFTPLPEVGSRLYLLCREKPSAWDAAASVYAQEALDTLGMTVTKAAATAAEGGIHVVIWADDHGHQQKLEAVIG